MHFQRLLRANWNSMHLRLSGQFFKEVPARFGWSLDRPGPFEKTRVLDPRPSQRFTQGLMQQLSAQWPVFAKAQIAQSWAGYIDMTPDEIPVIAPISAQPGLFMATGFSGHGFGIGPGAGELMADLIMGRNPVVDPTPFRFERFSDGSPIQLMSDVLG